MTMKRFDVLSLLESLYGSWGDGKELVVSHLNSEVLHTTRTMFVTLLIVMADFYIKNLTKSIVLYAPSFYRVANSC